MFHAEMTMTAKACLEGLLVLVKKSVDQNAMHISHVRNSMKPNADCVAEEKDALNQGKESQPVQ